MVGMSQQGAHHCPSTAPFLLHLVVKAFSILLRKYLSPFEGSKKQPMALTLEAGPLSGGSAQCRGETWVKTSVSPTEFRPCPPLEASPVCGWGIPAQSSLKTFELRAWASTLGAFGGERWLKQLPPTHTEPFTLKYLNLPKDSVLSEKNMYAQSLSSDSLDPMNVTCQAPPSMGFPRQEYWRGLPFPPPGDLPDAEIKPTSALTGAFFTIVSPWIAREKYTILINPPD